MKAAKNYTENAADVYGCERYPVWTAETLLNMLSHVPDRFTIGVQDEDSKWLDIKSLTPDNGEELQLLIVHGREKGFESWTVKKLREIVGGLDKNTVIQVQFTEPDTDKCGEPIWYDFDYLLEILEDDIVILVTRDTPTMQ